MKQIIEAAMQEIASAIKEWVLKIKAGEDGYKEAHEAIRQKLEEVYMKGRCDAVDYVEKWSQVKVTKDGISCLLVEEGTLKQAHHG